MTKPDRAFPGNHSLEKEAPKGTLVIIGGHEDKKGERVILAEVAKRLSGGRLVISTVASHEPSGYFDTYSEAFGELGLKGMTELYIDSRDESLDCANSADLETAGGIFFTGGDQLRISSQIGDTPFEWHVRKIYARGGVVAGTSAGASAMGETMLVRGGNGETCRVGDLHLAPGLGLLPGVIIDQHFAERGRIGRLLGAVALNPRILGIGIDENTAIVVQDGCFDVIGAGGVYIVDGMDISRSNVTGSESHVALSLFGAKLHVLSAGDCFDLERRLPCVNAAAKGGEKKEGKA